jgi:hypothetical protein
MAFGRLRRERRKKEEKERNERQKQSEFGEYQSNQGNLEEDRRRMEESYGRTPEERAEKSRMRREESEGRSRQKSEEFFNRDVSGLTPAQRRQMQESANMSLNRQMQGFQRQLTASQGRRGLGGGAAYAQQADLARMGQEAQRGIQSDIGQMDANLAMKKLAAIAALEKGEQSLSANDYQQAIDELRMENERKQNKVSQDYFNRLFTRI